MTCLAIAYDNQTRCNRGAPQSERITSKSCRLRISLNGGLLETRSSLARSSSVILISTFWTVSGSTGPKLHRLSAMPVPYVITHCFSGARLVFMASGGCIGSYSCLVTSSEIASDPVRHNLRRIFPSVFENDFAPPYDSVSLRFTFNSCHYQDGL